MSNHIGRNLKYYRQAAGLSTAKLAQRVGWSQTAIQDFEAGHIIPCELFLRVIAAFLGIVVAELTRDEPPPPKLVAVTDPAEDRAGLDEWRPLV